MPRTKKDQFADLSDEFKDSVSAMNESGIRNEITKIALAQVSNIEARDNDQDLTEKKEAAREAGAQYREATKANKTKLAWCRQVLSDKNLKVT